MLERREAVGESSHLWVQVQLRPAALVMCTPRGSPFPCPPFVPALHCLREGQVTEMSTHALAQCPELRVPLPLCPWVTYLFIIYLFKVYLSYLLVFIDGWKSGGHFCCMAGAAGSPPAQSLAFQGAAVCLGASLGRDPCGTCAPVPFWSQGGRKEGNHVGACGEDTPCPSPSHRSSKPLYPLPMRCAPSLSHLYLLTCPPGVSPFGSCWICCCQFPGMVGRARTCGCCYGEKTKPGILLPRGENRKEEKRKAGFAECLKHKMTLLSRGAWTSVSGCYYQLEQNVAFHFSGIKRKPLELYWNETLCLVESFCLSGLRLQGCGGAGKQEFVGSWPSAPALARWWDQQLPLSP